MVLQMITEYRGEFDKVIKEYKLLPVSKPSDGSILYPPISVDGKFRSLITINGRMPGPTIITQENQTLHITVHNKLSNVE